MAGDKINIQENYIYVVFLQSRNEQSETRIRKTTSLVITAGRIKEILGKKFHKRGARLVH